MGEVIGLVAVILIFVIPIVKIGTDHQRKVLAMKLQLGNQGDSGMRAELDALRREVHSLRDTCTQYDLSFDTALQRMESRVEGIERSVQSIQSSDVLRVGIGR